MSRAELRVKQISFGYEGPERCSLFKDLSLTLGRESPVAILGPSGCGKTTLLRLMAGLLRPDTGEIHAPGAQSFVFQEPRLLPWLRVLDNVTLPIREALGEAKARERGLSMLERFSLADKAGAYPAALSGGQRQRVSLARGFACSAPLMFMDEPFQSLDYLLRIELMDRISGLLEAEPRMLIMVTHDPREAVYLGKRIIVLGRPLEGVVFDEDAAYPRDEQTRMRLERRLLAALRRDAGPPQGITMSAVKG
ncbi:MAG: ABC transporter ATP-binding protein [Treponema sp.]|jgi:NitT/TauT family transport system ATP-binding protein|nr:ABC transporter ATP-binding protein [Treponema sp.]